MSTMKPILADSYQVRPIYTHKTQHYNYTVSGSGNPETVNIDIAVMPPELNAWGFHTGSEPINPDGTYQRILYSSVKQMFYHSGSVWNQGKKLTIPSGSQMYVLSFAQQTYGDKIEPSSFSLTVGSSTGSIIDDGEGNLTSNGNRIGHIFYALGLATIQYVSGSTAISNGGAIFASSSVLDITFKASHTIYEHSVMCSINVGELNYTMNPSILQSSFTGSAKIVDAFASGTLTPYMTTIGLYNNNNQLLAVGKFPAAIKRVPESQQTVILRWDI